MRQRNEEADADEKMLRISIDAKAPVKVGPFARGGKNRVPTKAADHDFQPKATVTPVGIFLPSSDEIFFYGVTSKVTSDCLVDRLADWWDDVSDRRETDQGGYGRPRNPTSAITLSGKVVRGYQLFSASYSG